MSLLNDVLKDLDQRATQDPDASLIQQSSIDSQFAAHSGRNRKLILASIAGGAALLACLAFFFVPGDWFGLPKAPKAPVVPAPVAVSRPAPAPAVETPPASVQATEQTASAAKDSATTDV